MPPGRFHDVDESAYHEYVCRRAGVNVHYCAEQFQNDGSPISTLIKSVKRTMAGEYSRELSVKAFAGQCRLIELGYRRGSPAGYGLRRQLIAMDGPEKELLSRGQHKSIQTDRVILVPGPPKKYKWSGRQLDPSLMDSRPKLRSLSPSATMAAKMEKWSGRLDSN
jgi:hypothetical protein